MIARPLAETVRRLSSDLPDSSGDGSGSRRQPGENVEQDIHNLRRQDSEQVLPRRLWRDFLKARKGRPIASAMICTCSTRVGDSGPDKRYFLPQWPSSRSARTATAAMSSSWIGAMAAAP